MKKLTKKENRQCLQCGEDFIALRNTYGMYCSRSCSSKSRYDVVLRPHCGNWKGRKHTEEWKQMMSEKLTGRTYSEETLTRMSEAAINRTTPHPMMGKHHSEESKERISESKKGCVPWMKGRSHLESSKKLMSENGNSGKITPIETRIKISKAGKEWWKDKKLPPDEKRAIQEIRSSLETKLWRSAVFQRDNFACVMCGNKKSGTLRAHHYKSFKDYPELRFAIDNGVTVCVKCHELIHSKKCLFLRKIVNG